LIALYSGLVVSAEPWEPGVQRLVVAVHDGGERPALCYEALCGHCSEGDHVIVNGTAVDLGLGTGGVDFVVASRGIGHSLVRRGPGHIVKGRYLPCQVAVQAVEELPEHAGVWERTLEGMPVVAAELHSQIVPIAFGIRSAGPRRIAYVMTDTGALPMAFSRTIARAKSTGLIDATLTCGQAFGGDYETVTLHSALLAARYIAQCDVAIVCQGPGNVGTGTKYGFGGIAQAYALDTAAQLGGAPICALRMSDADKRQRHRGVSHHTRTCLALAHVRCAAPVPEEIGARSIGKGSVVLVTGADDVLAAMSSAGWDILTMGRSVDEDPLFFRASAAAGLYAAAMLAKRLQ